MWGSSCFKGVGRFKAASFADAWKPLWKLNERMAESGREPRNFDCQISVLPVVPYGLLQKERNNQTGHLCPEPYLFGHHPLDSHTLEHKQRVMRSPLPLADLQGDVVPPALVQVNMCVITTCLGVCSHGNTDFLLNAKSRTTALSLLQGKLTKSWGCFSFPQLSLRCPWVLLFLEEKKQKLLCRRSVCSRAVCSHFEEERCEGWHRNLLLHLTGSHG